MSIRVVFTGSIYSALLVATGRVNGEDFSCDLSSKANQLPSSSKSAKHRRPAGPGTGHRACISRETTLCSSASCRPTSPRPSGVWVRSGVTVVCTCEPSHVNEYIKRASTKLQLTRYGYAHTLSHTQTRNAVGVLRSWCLGAWPSVADMRCGPLAVLTKADRYILSVRL